MSEKFSDRLRKIREQKQLSQSDLALKAGLQPSAVSHFEASRRSPSFDNLKRLADALSVTIDFLIGREKEPSVVGPVAEQVFRNLEKMSAADQEALAAMSEVLAKKNQRKEAEG
jgi:transcriptional regulator with XRE-family HTH domain